MFTNVGVLYLPFPFCLTGVMFTNVGVPFIVEFRKGVLECQLKWVSFFHLISPKVGVLLISISPT